MWHFLSLSSQSVHFLARQNTMEANQWHSSMLHWWDRFCYKTTIQSKWDWHFDIFHVCVGYCKLNRLLVSLEFCPKENTLNTLNSGLSTSINIFVKIIQPIDTFFGHITITDPIFTVKDWYIIKMLGWTLPQQTAINDCTCAIHVVTRPSERG